MCSSIIHLFYRFFVTDGCTCFSFHKDAVGQFTYWSQRTNARAVNCGLRLDYFMCSEEMFPAGAATAVVEEDDSKEERDPAARRVIEGVDDAKLPHPGVFDSYIIHKDTEGASDHCPVAVVVKL
jgi:exonuclease III